MPPYSSGLIGMVRQAVGAAAAHMDAGWQAALTELGTSPNRIRLCFCLQAHHKGPPGILVMPACANACQVCEQHGLAASVACAEGVARGRRTLPR